MLIVLLAAFLVVAPLFVVTAARATYDAGLRAENTGGERVTARLVTAAPEPRPAPFGRPGPPPRTQATAAWSYDGEIHTGRVRTLAGSPAGTPSPSGSTRPDG